MTPNARPQARTPSQDRELDQARRAAAQARKPVISTWSPDVPAGFIHVDDAIEYMRRRWGKLIRTEMYEEFSTNGGGPKQYFFGTTPDKRGERYYMFDDVDMWVWRTVSGVPASFLETYDRKSSVPVTLVPDDMFQKLLGATRNGEEQSNVGSGLKEDGRWWDETSGTEDSNGGEGDRRTPNGRGPWPS